MNLYPPINKFLKCLNILKAYSQTERNRQVSKVFYQLFINILELKSVEAIMKESTCELSHGNDQARWISSYFGRNGVEIKREVRVLAKKDNHVISCLSCLKDLLDFI